MCIRDSCTHTHPHTHAHAPTHTCKERIEGASERVSLRESDGGGEFKLGALRLRQLLPARGASGVRVGRDRQATALSLSHVWHGADDAGDMIGDIPVSNEGGESAADTRPQTTEVVPDEMSVSNRHTALAMHWYPWAIASALGQGLLVS
eukprot:1713573-Rhodomonas_salina.2